MQLSTDFGMILEWEEKLALWMFLYCPTLETLQLFHYVWNIKISRLNPEHLKLLIQLRIT